MLGKCRGSAVLLTCVQTLVLSSCVTMGKANTSHSGPGHLQDLSIKLKLQAGFALLQGG